MLEHSQKLYFLFEPKEFQLLTVFQVEYLYTQGEFSKGLNIIANLIAREKLSDRHSIVSKLLHLIGLAELGDEIGIHTVARNYSHHSNRLPFHPLSKAIIVFVKTWGNRKLSKRRVSPNFKRNIALQLFEKFREDVQFQIFYNRIFNIESWLKTFDN